MTIPKEIQDLMPEKFNHPKGSCTNCNCRVYNQALTEVEAILPQMLALAEKRGAERERGALRKNITNYVNTKFLDGVVIDPLELYEALTQPNHE